jgi:glycerol kinase
MADFVLALDQGTTSSRAIVFDGTYRIRGLAQREFPQIYPKPGWVEHDPQDLWHTIVETMRSALADAGLAASDIAAIGITNQRETVVVWDRETGRAIHNAIVWQDRRTADLCAALKADGSEVLITDRTGLLADPYFSATKIAWILDNVEGARTRAERGELAFGTVDTWLLWHLTGGRRHVTDATNASRTMLCNIDTGEWDEDLLRLFQVPRATLPEIRDCIDDFGATDPRLFGVAIPIRGVAGDQQAATVGQACFSPGMMKSTYGTGCFALLNTGPERVPSKNRLLSTIAYRINGRTTYALEGSIFIAGAAVQWLREGSAFSSARTNPDRLRHRPILSRKSISFRPSLALERRGGSPMRGERSMASRATPVRMKSRGRRWNPCASRRGIFWMPCVRIGQPRPTRFYVWTAAWWRVIGRCNGSPTF